MPKKQHDFTTYMNRVLHLHIVRQSRSSTSEIFEHNSVRIAVLSTELYAEEDDYFIQGAEYRIMSKKNFVDPASDDCRDFHGHGTHG